MGPSSWRVESWGCDALWSSRGAWYGVQRKTLKDLVASVEDGRLATERLQWPSVTGGVWLIVETGERGGADPREMPNGALAALGKFGRPWTGAQYRALLLSLGDDEAVNGVLTVAGETETIERVKEVRAWTMKDRHASARGRAKVQPDVFGDRTNRAYGVHLLTSLPGVGLDTANAIWDHFGGMPLQVREGVGMKELQEVAGVGKVTAARIMGVFGDG